MNIYCLFAPTLLWSEVSSESCAACCIFLQSMLHCNWQHMQNEIGKLKCCQTSKRFSSANSSKDCLCKLFSMTSEFQEFFPRPALTYIYRHIPLKSVLIKTSIKTVHKIVIQNKTGQRKQTQLCWLPDTLLFEIPSNPGAQYLLPKQGWIWQH